MTVKSRLLASLAIPVVLLALISFIAIRSLSSINASVASIYDDRVVPLKQLKLIADAYAVFVIDAVNKGNAGLFTAEQVNGELNSANKVIREEWQRYTATKLTDEERALVREAEPLFRSADQAIAAVQGSIAGMQGNASSQLSQFDGPLYQQIDPISAHITKLIDLQLRVAAEQRETVATNYSSLRLFFILMSLAVTAILLAAGWWLYRSIAGPLLALNDTMKQAEQQLDLTLTVDANRDDEWGEAGKAFNQMLARFREVLRSVGGVVEQTAKQAGAVTNEIGEATNACMEQQRESDQVAAASTQMSASITEVARNASAAAEAAKVVSHSTEGGRQAVSSVANAMQELQHHIEEANNVITRLDQQAGSIGQVLEVIRGIAEQTNLLALNAAIEAARAGDQGRGFAVVADEVRNLAQRTQESTKEIAGIIEQLQRESQAAVDSMQTSRSSAGNSLTIANQAGSQLDEIDRASHTIAEMTTQIATATEQQAAVSETISRNMVRIHELSGTVARCNERVRQACGEMRKEVQELVGLSARFTV